MFIAGGASKIGASFGAFSAEAAGMLASADIAELLGLHRVPILVKPFFRFLVRSRRD
jgi:hypothetical protein